MSMSPRLAFVTPWYGPDAPGGAEALARRTCEQLCAAGVPVEVLTTCARDVYSDWGHDHYRPGLDIINGVPVRRFPVRRPRDRAAFDAVNIRLMAGGTVSADDEVIFMREMICSDDLLDYIARHCTEYIFCFLPYMFGTTYWGAQICPERSWLMPCLHDEPYAHMAIYRSMFAQVHGLLFLSRPEMALAQRLYPIGDKPMYLVGAGVDSDYTGDAAAFRRKFGIEAPFLLYAGRKEAAKNVPLLLDYYRTYRRQTGGDVKLVFVGGGALPARVGPAEGVYDLGRLARTDLFDAYAAALALCQPSRYESFSFVLMEAWVAGTPGLVYEGCAVTTDFVRQANGGLYFADYAEFAACVNLLLAQPDLRKRLGQQGRAYVLAQFAWPVVIKRYRCILQQIAD